MSRPAVPRLSDTRARPPGAAAPGRLPWSGGGLWNEPAPTLVDWWLDNRERFLARRLADVRAALNPATHADATGTREGAEVREALLRVVEEERGAQLVAAALIALGRVSGAGPATGRDASLDALLAGHLRHPVRDVSEAACMALGHMARGSGALHLVSLLEDEPAGRKLVHRSRVPHSLRLVAAHALAELGRRTNDLDVRRYAELSLVRALDAPREELRAAAALALANVASEGSGVAGTTVLEALAGRLAAQREESSVRAQAALALGVRLPRAAPASRRAGSGVLIEALGAREEEVRQGAALALGLALEDAPLDLVARAREALEAALTRGLPETRGYVALSLARVAAELPGSEAAARRDVLRLFLERLADGAVDTRGWTALALGLLGHELVRPDDGLRASSRAAGRPASPRGPLEAIRDALRHELADARSPEIVTALALGTGLSGDAGSGEVLLEQARRVNHADLRRILLGAVGMTNERGAIEPLRAWLADAAHDGPLLGEVALALSLLGDAEIVPRLAEDRVGGCGCQRASAATARALGLTGDPGATRPLLAMLSDPDLSDEARSWAALSLGRLGDPAPWQGRAPAR